jgi:hypothetical protein
VADPMPAMVEVQAKLGFHELQGSFDDLVHRNFSGGRSV